MIKWRDKKWLVGAIVVPAVLAFAAWGLSKSPSQNLIGNVSNGAFATQNQVGNNVFSVQTPHHFSETQSIKLVPKHLGGTYTLNLDNVATLRAGRHTKTGQIALFLDSPAISLPDKSFALPSKEIPGFSATAPRTSNTGMITMTLSGNDSGVSFEDVTIIPNTGKTYVFDLGQNQRQEVAVEGRTFVVRLIELKQLDVPGVAAPVEYVFGISDK